MAVAIEMDFKGATLEQYDEVMKLMGFDDGTRPRRPARSSTGPPRPRRHPRRRRLGDQGGIRQVRGRADRAVHARQAGIAGPPETTYREVHNHLGGSRTGYARHERPASRGPPRPGSRPDSGPHAVHEPGQALRQRRVVDLQHVLGVLLARVREVEAAEEDDVVGDGDLRVHVVVHGARAPRRRALAGEAARPDHAEEERELPRGDAGRAPLVCTSSIWVWSTAPRTSTFPSATPARASRAPARP